MKNWIPAFAGMTNHIIRQGVPWRKSGKDERTCFKMVKKPVKFHSAITVNVLWKKG